MYVMLSLPGQSIALTNEATIGQTDEKVATSELYFIKRQKGSIPGTNINEHVQVSTSIGSPMHSLYLAIQNIYAPQILSSGQGALDNKLQSTLMELQKSLKGMIIKTGTRRNTSETDVSGIQSVSDELNYWKQAASSGGHAASRADCFVEYIQKLEESFSAMTTSTPYDDMVRMMEDGSDFLTDLWNEDKFNRGGYYPQVRFERLLEVMGHSFVSYIKGQFAEISIWHDSFLRVQQAIHTCTSICDQWLTISSQLSDPQMVARWEGKAFRDDNIINLQTRLRDILEVRGVAEELLRLLPKEDHEKFNLSQLFTPFETIDVMLVGPFSEPKWKSAVSEFNQLLTPVETHASSLLKSRIFALSDRPQLLVGEFRNFPLLLLRKNISHQLEAERETLLGQLLGHLENIRGEFDAHSGGFVGSAAPPTARNLSPNVNSIVWANQLVHKVNQTTAIVMKVLPDVNNIDNFQSSSREIKSRIVDYAKELFTAWTDDLLDQLRDQTDELVLQTNGTLMELDLKNQGQLVVHYSERLVVLLREVRQLSELGYKIDRRVQKTVETGEKYYRYGIKLKQVANFYNTMSEQIIPSQLGMLLSEAQKFERFVKDTNGVTWDNPDSCDRYMTRLMNAAEALTSRNRKLRAIHVTMANNTTQLMNIDLLRNRETWLDQYKKMQQILNREERNSAIWRHHWDEQLYKAFELQYRSCLDQLNDNLFDISVDLIFQRKKLCFRPALEDLRMKYYRNLKKFLDMPKNFKGFGQAELYRYIPERNSSGLYNVYNNAETLFLQLQKIRDSMKKWVVLGQIDLDEFVESRLSEVAEWEYNFKMLKKKRKEVERLPDQKKVGCFTVSLVPFKSAVDDILQRYSDALMLSLRKSAGKNVAEVDEYLSHAMEHLNARPNSVEEMGNAKKQWRAISDNKSSIQRVIQMIKKKNTLLKQMVNVTLDISSLKPRWESFLVALEAFNDMLEDQRDNLKNDIEKRIKDCKIEVDKFASRWKALKPSAENEVTRDAAEKILSEIKDWQEELELVNQTSMEIIKDAESFDMPLPTFDGLDGARNEITAHQQSWAEYNDYVKELEIMTEQKWLDFRPSILDFESFLQGWKKKLKGRVRDVVFQSIAKELKMYFQIWPILRKVTGELFEKEHWKLLFAKLKFPNTVDLSNLTLGNFLRNAQMLIKMQREINHLAARAQGEVTIREAVQELQVWAEEASFTLTTHTTADNRATHLIKGWKDLFTVVSDQQSLVASLKESPYFAPFKAVSEVFEVKLSVVDECLHSMNQIQRKWVYLEPIFTRGSLPQEAARFSRIDSDFRSIMDEVGNDNNIMNFADIAGLKDTVTVLLDQLDRCQRALNDFLELKRSKFPRFYFIGDDDLLEILGQAQNPVVIQSHLKKLFGGIHSVNFSDDMKMIQDMKSSKGEVVPLLQPVLITQDVEDWLANLAAAMQKSLAQLLVDCVKECDYNKYPSQVLCLAELVSFTARCESAINIGKNGLIQLKAELNQQLEDLTSTDASDDNLLDLKIKALVLDLIHNIEVVELFIASDIKSTSDWLWQKQLRFYLNKDGQCIMRMTDSQFNYSYEYQGNSSKLVHTPLTDKCYLVLTQGMHLGYGGNPYGPAGTGKTESIKALGNAFGRQVLVFNCDEGIDFKSMGRIFTGLVKSGAWGCFDEFNRLKEDQLSAISQQIQVIQAALKNNEPTCDLLGKIINVNGNAAIFVTMNPASREYGGRSKLPHNLKQLFRAVAMSRPDLDLITRVILYSEGFKHAKKLGNKLVEVYKLSKQLLSPQKHYDWGLRALKTVLSHGGALIHREKKKGSNIDEALETKLLIGALRINTLSKLTYSDSVRFTGLINDVFPNLKIDEIDYTELVNAIKQSLSELKMEVVDTQIKKILQLHASLNQRMGCVIVGPSGCGKSVMLNVLHRSLERLGQKIKRHVMNPKALERHALLGHMDHDTREWTDGVLTKSARLVVDEPAGVHSWVICDGDIDTEWIESLNSVLDDNHLLTMPNGERIQFGNNVNFVFESHDLQHASPATISRMGMIFLSEEDVDIKSLVTSWVSRQDQKLQSKYVSWIDDMFFKALEYMFFNEQQIVPTTRAGLVLTSLSHLVGATTKGEFVCGLIRGMGSNLSIPDRTKFAKEVFGWANERAPDASAPLDCFFNAGSNRFQQLLPLDQKINPIGISVRSPPIIHTVDVQRNKLVLEPWLQRREPFIVVGPEGCGKTLLLRHCFSSLKNAVVTTINCSSQTNANDVIMKIKSTCAAFSTNKGRVYRPKGGDQLVIFLRNLNLPKPDEYDTIEMIALLQQLITYQGFYDGLEWVSVEGLQIVGAMNPGDTVGRSQLSTRFTAIVHILYIDYPDNEQLQSIYTSFFKVCLKISNKENGRIGEAMWKSSQNVRKLCGSMITVYEKVRQKFSVDDYRHYLFSPRDLTEWCFGLLRYDLSKERLLDVWAYEAHRLFGDRFVERDHIRAFESILNGVLRNVWKHEAKLMDRYYSSMTNLGDGGNNRDGNDDDERPVPAALKEVGPLLEAVGGDMFKEMIAEGIHGYEREFKGLDMLLFPEILDHIAVEDRVLSRPGGSMLLVGDSGVGRRTSVTVVSFMQKIELWTPNVTMKYNDAYFRADMKDLLRRAGVENQKICLYLEDHQIVDDAILEDVNSLLSSGEIPGLYPANELDALLGPLKEEFDQQGYGCKTCFEFFVQRVTSNLHVVISMDPNHPDFIRRCESNPALLTRTVIVWMGKWSRDGMMQVPRERLEPVVAACGQHIDEQQLLDNALYIHNSCLAYGNATPIKYISFLKTYSEIFFSEQKVQKQKQSHLQGGLSKLQDAAALVDDLTAKATEKKVLVTNKQKEADAALETITDRMAVASQRRVEVENLQVSLGEEEKKLQAQSDSIKQELSGIEPVLTEAKNAVQGIRKDNLNEIRSLRMPPPAIRHVLSGVLMLMGQEDLSWSTMKSFLGKSSVKDEIINFDASCITPGIRKKVMVLLKKEGESFAKERIRRVNIAAAPLAAWVKANVKYSSVLQSIKPLRDQLASATARLDGARRRFQECQDDLVALDSEVQQLKATFAKTTSEAESLKVSLKQTTDILDRAQSLLGKLGGEKDRWEGQVGQLSAGLMKLPYHALLAAAFTTYMGGFEEGLRSTLLQDWSSKCGVERFDYMSFMATESEFLEWKAEGLPSDTLSMQNGLVIMNSKQCPFIIDPNTQATAWLKKHLEGKSLEVVQQQSKNFVTTLELAVRFGKTIIVQEVDGVVPLLFPLLRHDLIRQGPRWVIQIGDKTVDYNENFRIFLVTRDSHPVLTPNARSLISEVNFSITRSGLEGQLLGITLHHEKPELETQKSALLAEEDRLKIQQSELEKQLLQELAASEGNILENKSLLESLDKTKSQSIEIEKSLTHSREIQNNLDSQRDVYRPIARAGSILFFLIDALIAVNNMYDFSLPTFIRLFQLNLDSVGTHQSSNAGDTRSHIKKLISSLKLRIFHYATRSLFKSDRLMFALHLIHCLHKRQFQPKEWEFFTGEPVPAQMDPSSPEARLPNWAPAERQKAYTSFAITFPHLVRQLSFSDATTWSSWVSNPNCERDFPSPGGQPVSPFQRLMVIQALRPDRLMSAIQRYACRAMQLKTVAPPPLSLEKILGESSNSEPILFVTTAGADPSQELEDFAFKVVGKNSFQQLAMGSGQAETAMELLSNAARDGTWLLLKNLHLVTPWLYNLEKTLKAMELHPNFRLWLTTEEHPNFPPILLQSSLKITYESPPGIKQNLLRTYESWDEQFIAKGSVTRAQMLFILSWFHAIVQERRVYIPQGWTKYYEFSFADLRSGADILDAVFSRINPQRSNEVNPQAIPWATIWGLLEYAIYGGRIDNDHDFRILKTYLHKFFNPRNLAYNSAPAQVKLVPGLEIPSSNNKQDYMSIIHSVPDNDSPTTFSLSANVSGAVQESQSTSLLSQLRKLAVSGSDSGRFNREAWRQQLGPLLQLWDQELAADGSSLLKKPMRVSIAESKLGPIDGFVVFEARTIYQLVQKVNSAIKGIQSVVYGSGLLSPLIMEDGNVMLKGETPWRWAKHWIGPEDPAKWMRELATRKRAVDHWLAKVEQGALMQHPVVLSQIFRARTFLNALRQQTARVCKIPIDDLKLTVAWNPSLLPRSASVRMEMHGLFLQGCSFAGNQLGSLSANSPILCSMPPCTFAFIKNDDPEPYPGDQALAVPVYASASREEFVCEVRVPCSGSLQAWILTGVAIFLSDVK